MMDPALLSRLLDEKDYGPSGGGAVYHVCMVMGMEAPSKKRTWRWTKFRRGCVSGRCSMMQRGTSELLGDAIRMAKKSMVLKGCEK